MCADAAWLPARSGSEISESDKKTTTQCWSNAGHDDNDDEDDDDDFGFVKCGRIRYSAERKAGLVPWAEAYTASRICGAHTVRVDKLRGRWTEL